MLTASEILQDWTKNVLREFGLHEGYIFSSTSDADPVVRCTLTKLLNLRWEWCCSHMLANVVKEASGKLQSQSSRSVCIQYRLIFNSHIFRYDLGLY